MCLGAAGATLSTPWSIPAAIATPTMKFTTTKIGVITNNVTSAPLKAPPAYCETAVLAP